MGSDFLSKRYDLDRKDLKILDALDKLGGQATALDVGKQTGFPARTVRYRIARLLEKGMLLPSFMQTSERRIGLGEKIMVLQEAEGKDIQIEKILQHIPIFYWYIPTHGKYDGYLVHTVYDILEPRSLEKVTEVMKEDGLIEKCSFFDIKDFLSKDVDFKQYRPDGEWIWDWKAWMEDIEDNLSEENERDITFDLEDNLIDFDAIDVRIVRQLKIDPDTSPTALATLTKESIDDIRKRIKRLEEHGVLRGIRRAYGFAGDLLWFSCFIAIKEAHEGVLTSILDMPFPGILLTESQDKHCIRMGLSTTDLKRFLLGFKKIRPHLKSYYFQFHLPDLVDSKYLKIFDLYDTESNAWNIDTDEYIAFIKKVSSENAH